MKVYTDRRRFADSLLGTQPNWERGDSSFPSPLEPLAKRLFSSGPFYSADVRTERFWENLFLVEKAQESHFDLLAEASEATQGLPGPILCLAGTGEGFHGQHQRPWAAEQGNLHISAIFRPCQDLDNCGIGFTVLAVVSVLQVLDTLGIRQSGVKWVNDILVSETKVGGVLVHIKTQGRRVTCALVGIGLNVEKKPYVKATPFVPSVASLKQFSDRPESCTRGDVFRSLAATLAENYTRFVEGNFSELLNIYRRRSVVLGRSVAVYEELDNEALSKIAGGKVISIGDNLELSLEGRAEAVSRGRLVLEKDDYR